MAESEFITIKANVDQCLNFFNGLDVNKKAIKKKILSSVGTGAKQAVKRNYGSILHRKSGTLYKSIFSKVKWDGTGVYVSNRANSGKPTGKDGRNARYGFMLASGYTVEAKTSKGLTFNVNGKWVRTHSVTVAPKDWVEPAVVRYARSAECENRMETTFQKQIDYWEKRITGRVTR